MQKKLIYVAAGIALVLTAVASTSLAADKSTVSRQATPTVAMVSFAGDEYFNGYVTGAKARAKNLGIKLNVQLAKNYEPSSETATVNAAIATHPDYLLVSAVNSTAMRAPLLAASKRGVKIITYDTNTTNPTFVLTYVNADYFEYGHRAGVELTRLIGGHGKVILLNYGPGNEGLDALSAGFKKSIRPPVVALPLQYDNADSAKANAIIRATLTREPDLAGFVAISGGGGDGAITALKEAHKIGKIKVVLLSARKASIKALRAGTAQVVVAEALLNIGAGAVQAAYDDSLGKKLPKRIYIPLCVITPKTINAPKNLPCLQKG